MKSTNKFLTSTNKKEITMRIHTEVKGWRASYRGKIYYRLVCPETNESIEAGTSKLVTLNSSQHNEPQLTAAKIDLTRLTPGRRYEVHVEIDEMVNAVRFGQTTLLVRK